MAWDLSRIVIVVNGGLKATFTDNVILLLNESADTFLLVHGKMISSRPLQAMYASGVVTVTSTVCYPQTERYISI